VSSFLQLPVSSLSGLGPERAKLLAEELGIIVFEDLLSHFPFRYVDRSQYYTVQELPYLDIPVQLKGYVTDLRRHTGSKRKLSAFFSDSTGTIELVWFHDMQWLIPMLQKKTLVQLYGKATKNAQKWSINHPEIIEYDKVEHTVGWQPVYSTTAKLTKKNLHSKGLEALIKRVLRQLESAQALPETLPDYLLKALHLTDRTSAFIQIHQPASQAWIERAKTRLKFEELFYLQLELLIRKQINTQKISGFKFPKIGTLFTDFYHKGLPFKLTDAQKRVLREIRSDFLTGHHANRLLQGDVGSGKTLVAIFSALISIENGFQVALVAPTEILAHQHKATIDLFLRDFPVKIELLTGSTRAKSRKIILEELLEGKIHLLVGTHAILENTVLFKNIGLAIIDEQHRFGVAQRSKMHDKNNPPPHILIMTATPIPRTLAMTFYGDLDVSTIDELPPGRKEITTIHQTEGNRAKVFGFIRKEIEKGHQIYIVYPLIEESKKLELNNLMNGFDMVSEAFPKPEYQISILHGQMKPKDKEWEMERFVNKETHIMIATTVIEVGVNVPNASVMIIENAERFGLSQLHQLRGRVGRGNQQAYCILITGNKYSKDTLTRIQTMTQTNDGFKIAEVDLQLRGPGNLLGTEQSGIMELKIADLTTDTQLVVTAREAARKLIEKDALLVLKEHEIIRQEINKIVKNKINWGEIA